MSTSIFRSLDTEFLLDQLDEERRKFSNANDDVIRGFVGELVARGEYREPIGTPHEVKPFVPLESILKAVWGYGARWHRFREPFECPHCKADLRDHDNGPPFKREIGRVVNDYVDQWSCPDCGKTWPRGSR